MSKSLVVEPSSDCLSPRPIDCNTLICDLEGEANTILCRFLIFIPVENVPRDATIIESFCVSTIPRIASRSSVATPPDTKKTYALLQLQL